MNQCQFDCLAAKIDHFVKEEDVGKLALVIDHIESDRDLCRNQEHILSFSRSIVIKKLFDIVESFELPTYIGDNAVHTDDEIQRRKVDSSNLDLMLRGRRGETPWQEPRSCQSKTTRKKRGLWFWYKQADIDRPQDILVHSTWIRSTIHGIVIVPWKENFNYMAILEKSFSPLNDGRFCIGYNELRSLIPDATFMNGKRELAAWK